MPTVHFRFYAELNDFLPGERRMVPFTHSYAGRQSVKHLIEALGVPHTEVDLILANGRSVDFSYAPEEGDHVSVYPTFEAFDVREVSRVRPRPLRQTRFLLDSHLGGLAGYLRMLGFDTLYRGDFDDGELVRLSLEEGRILLTKDRDLLMRRALTHAYYVRESSVRQQLLEVINRFDLAGSVEALTRCLLCNRILAPASKESVADRVPPRSRQSCDRFWECPGCRRVYWNGSHYRRMERFAAEVIDSARRAARMPE